MVIHRTNSGHAESSGVTWSDETFVLALRHALRNIYDPDELKKSPLMRLLSLDELEAPPSLQNILTSAIRELKPDSSLSSQSHAWRIYNILNSRYIQQFQQEEVARSVGLSARQMRRLDRLALLALAEHIWTYNRKDTQHNPAPGAELTRAAILESNFDRQSNELTWLEQTQVKEVISTLNLATAITKTIEPLTRSLNIVVEYVVPDHLPDVVVKLLPLRQAVLTLLTTFLNHCHDGKIVMRAQPHSNYNRIEIDADCIFAEPPASKNDLRESLRIASQLVALSGGTIEIAPSLFRPGFDQIVLTLPVSEKIVALVIDDNEDTLLLFQRFLVKTQYLVIGARNFNEAMAAIEHTIPHIIILDVMMPEIDGWELLERLREFPKTHDRPIIMCSILPQEQLALMFGAAAFIRKPITQESILRILDELSWRPRQETG
jgi:CheY-like chemotaxis protein